MNAALRQGRFEARLRVRFRHASAERTATDNVIVELRHPDGHVGYGEGCPRSYVTGETASGAAAFIAAHGERFVAAATDVAALTAWTEANRSLIDASPAAFAALEIAALDLMGQRSGQPLEDLIGAPRLAAPAIYSAILGNAAPRATRLAVAAYRLAGFRDFKVKLSGDPQRDRRRLAALPHGASVRADANNLWPDSEAAITGLRALDFPFTAIEEPVQAGDVAGMRAVAGALDVPVILDESLARIDQLAPFTADPGRWVANIRVSKCGGVLRSVALARAARAKGLDVILGAHVGETSILTRAALAVGQALEPPPLAREGAFGTILLARDLAAPPLRFGYGARLDPVSRKLATAPGLGLKVHSGFVNWAGPARSRASAPHAARAAT